MITALVLVYLAVGLALGVAFVRNEFLRYGRADGPADTAALGLIVIGAAVVWLPMIPMFAAAGVRDDRRHGAPHRAGP